MGHTSVRPRGPLVHVDREPDARRGVFGLTFGLSATIFLAASVALLAGARPDLIPLLPALILVYAAAARTAVRWATGAYTPAVIVDEDAEPPARVVPVIVDRPGAAPSPRPHPIGVPAWAVPLTTIHPNPFPAEFGERWARRLRLDTDFHDVWLHGHDLYFARPGGVLTASLHDHRLTATGDLTITVPVGRRRFELVLATATTRRSRTEIRALAAALSQSPYVLGREAARRALALIPGEDAAD